MKFTRMLRNKLLFPNHKFDFLYSLAPNATILDIGCGNNSSLQTKRILPNCYYIGIDISDYNHESNASDVYIVTKPEDFSNSIDQFKNVVDAAICSHNLEHVNDRFSTLLALMRSCRVSGRIYLSFPTENSVNFPSRNGTLNYYDDASHKGLPPSFDKVMEFLHGYGYTIEFAARNYSPLIPRILGKMQENRSKRLNKVLRGTWAYWGFESIIIARKEMECTEDISYVEI
jgi:SAM-dependent methyltransferase